ncbi:hypothetical protein IT774_05190 [Salinimonas marina]|uniref:Uncharacterized protein n=1 Tax=Salinimonas marina TaxID=2785918 RepID=A0A7S9DZ16_9ALTE|nr:hypothetical protein [Salinimonas marina]QPG06569.1 hypothetical protein IT774_05190 [Salinimonas marina]
MSELLYFPLTQEQAPWKTAIDRVFEIEAGRHTGKVIRVSLAQFEEDLNQDGTIDQINVKATSSIVDRTTGEPLMVGAKPVKTVGKVESLATSALAEGTETMTGFLAECADEAIFRVIRLEGQLISLAEIPTIQQG